MENDIIMKDYSQYVEVGKKSAPKILRTPYTQDEIDLLFKMEPTLDYIDAILITIFAGLRPSELLLIELDNVHLKDRYMVGGIKTEAGKDRIIPINKKILPFIEKRYREGRKNGYRYLIVNFKGEQMKYSNFKREKFDNIMEQLNMEHLPHDGRHTCATLLDRAGANKLSIKRILGHASQDVTDKVYTHKDIQDLLDAIDLI